MGEPLVHGRIRLDRRDAVPPVQQIRGLLRLTTPRSGDAARPWILFAQGRSGSTLLGELLASHPGVVFGDEILYRPVWYPRAWVESRRRRHPGASYGFHVKPYQLTVQQGVTDVPGWLRRFTDDGWLLIHLQRENVLRQALSNAVQSRTGVSFLRDGQDDRRSVVQVDPQEILDAMELRRRLQEQDRQAVASLPAIELSYERDLQSTDDQQRTADRVLAALGLSPVAVTTELRPTRRTPSEQFSNWDQIRSAVAASSFAHLLENVDPPRD